MYLDLFSWGLLVHTNIKINFKLQINLSKLVKSVSAIYIKCCKEFIMVLRLEGVKKSFRNSEELVPVLQGVSFDLQAGDTL